MWPPRPASLPRMRIQFFGSAPQQAEALSGRTQAGLRRQEQREFRKVSGGLVPFPVGQFYRATFADFPQFLQSEHVFP